MKSIRSIRLTVLLEHHVMDASQKYTVTIANLTILENFGIIFKQVKNSLYNVQNINVDMKKSKIFNVKFS